MTPNSDYCFYELYFRGAIRLLKTFFMIAHKFSIGFRSGELPGHSKTVNLAFLKKISIFLCVAGCIVLLENLISIWK